MSDAYHPTHAYGPARAMAEPEKSRTPGRLARGRLMVIGVVSALFAAAVVVVPVVSAGADPEPVNFVVTSAAWGGPDNDLSDPSCKAASGLCTLRAAIEQSNYRYAQGQPGAVSITVDNTIPLNTKMGTGGSSPSIPGDLMLQKGNKVSNDDTGAYFNVTGPVTIDLGHRLQVDASGARSSSADVCDNDDLENCAAFYLNGPDIQVVNADQVMAMGSSFVVGPLAKRVTIDGDTAGGFGQITTPTNYPRGFVVFREAVETVTVQNYQVTGYSAVTSDDYRWSGIFVFDSFAPYTPMSNIVINNVQVLLSSTDTTCSTSHGQGCHPRLLNFWSSANATVQASNNADARGGAWSNNTINGLTFKNMLIQNMTTQYAFQFRDWGGSTTNTAKISDLRIENNVFKTNQGNGTDQYHAFVTLPYGNNLSGTNSISNNVFMRASSGNYYAITYVGGEGSNSTAASNLTIANNYFDGYTGASTIRTATAGLVTVTGNTFGKLTGSQPAPGLNEEYFDAASLMYNTNHSPNYSTNLSVRTWAPTATATVMTQPNPDALVMDDPRDGAMSTCPATVDVKEITDTSNPVTKPADPPVLLQAYWTSGQTAEVYLGQVEVTSRTSATLQVQLPVGEVPLHDGIPDKTTIVNSTSGVAGGQIRLQTHLEGYAQLASSQYSRMVSLSGNCRPVLTINQASGDQIIGDNTPMADPTYTRDLHFTLKSSVPLDPSTVTADDFTVITTAVDQTIYPDDLSLLYTRVVSVVPDPDGNNMAFDVIVRVDDSAKVTVTVDAEKVETTSGLTNQNPATYKDNSITFLNPLQVDPASFTLVTGEEKGKTFTIKTVQGAPVPQADLMFIATVEQTAGTTVSLSTTGPVMQANQTSTPAVTVTASEADTPVAANTPTPITLTVESSDSNYDGLIMPTVTPYLFSTDPTISVQKQAYTGMTDTSSVAGILSSGGVESPVGTRLMDGQTVCFVYTVTNTSKDNWPTSLKDIVVTDSDKRLGSEQDGVIGTINTLGMNDPPAKLFWCTSLMPVDTTIGS